LRDLLHALGRVGLNYVREIVDQTGRCRNLDALLYEEDRGGTKDGEQIRRRGKSQQKCVQDLLSLDFTVREEVYLADDSTTT
jgi:hypothetical protein